MTKTLQNGVLGTIALGAANILKEELAKGAEKRIKYAAATAWDTAEDYARSAFSGSSSVGSDLFNSSRPARYNGAFARYAMPRFRRRGRSPARRRRGLRGTVRRRGRKGRRGPYNKKSKKMRPFNRGPLSLQKRLMDGGTLPYQTAVSLYYRATDTMIFNNLSADNSRRTFCMNNIAHVASPLLPSNAPFRTGWRYLDLWKTLYERYLIIGSVMRISLVLPRIPYELHALGGIGTYPGFWYARVYYRRAQESTAGGEVGHYMSQQTSTMNTEALWNNRREFQADPTVTYVMDGAPRNYKVGYITGPTNASGDTNVFPSASTSIEMDFPTRAVNLKVNFSLKRHRQTQNPLATERFLKWDHLNQTNSSFLVHFGYIAFSQDGAVSRHTPMNRVNTYNATIDFRVKAILREPLIGPEGPIDLAARSSRPVVFDDGTEITPQLNSLDLQTENMDLNSLDLQTENMDLNSEVSQLYSDEENSESEESLDE